MKAALVISERDNVATALHALEPGGPLEVAGTSLTVRDPIPSGHKIATRAIAGGDFVFVRHPVDVRRRRWQRHAKAGRHARGSGRNRQ